jgi:Na+/phosphate symporter
MANLSWSAKSSSIPSMCSSSYYASNNNNNQSTIQNTRLDDKIESVTVGLQDYYVRLIKKQLSQNAETIADYIFAMNIEVNPSMHHRSS